MLLVNSSTLLIENPLRAISEPDDALGKSVVVG